MAEVKQEAELGVSADEAWKLVGDFVGQIKAMGAPVEAEGEGIGMTRSISMGPGDPIVERLEALDDAAKSITYSIVSGPLPVANYRSTMTLTPAGDRCTLSWVGTFDPAAGASEDVAVQTINAVYAGGLAAFKKQFGE